MFAYCNNTPVSYSDSQGTSLMYTCDLDEGYDLDDDWWRFAGGGSIGGAGGLAGGVESSYYNYLVNSRTAAYDAGLGGYYYGGSGFIGGYTAAFAFGFVSVTDSMAVSNGGYLNFKTKQDLESHFIKHGGEFENLYSNSQEYLQGANYVVNNGTYVPEMNGYLKFYGANGHANYAFVGLTRNGAYITTFSIRSVGSLSLVPWLK